MRTLWLDTHVGPLRVVRAGPPEAASALICWPGLGLVAEEFHRLLREAEAAGCQMVAVDPPGHGQSPPAPELDWDDVLRLLEAVAGRVRARGYVLVGHSVGAVAAVMASAALGDRLRGLVAADGALRPVLRGRTDAELEAENRAWLAAAFDGWGQAIAWARADLRAWDDDVEAGVRALLAEGPDGRVGPRGDRATLTRWAALARDFEPLHAPWPDCSVLALVGEGGQGEEGLATLRRRVPALRVEHVPGAGHELFWDRPAEASAAIWRFARPLLGL